MEDITKLFCLVDDFCRDIEKNFAGKLLPNGKKPTRTTEIEHSEIMTIILLYQQSPCKNFKTFYLHYLTLLYKSEFPKLPSYTRFVALKPRVLWHLAMLLHWLCGQSENTGISYIDTTPIAVCHAKRISKNKVFAGIAKLSKSTYGWFFGFKLHMVINENGEIHALTLTKGNVDDRIPVPNLTEKLTGLLFGDKGYIAKELFQKLFDRGLKLVTKVKKGMKNTLISLNEKILLRKRSIIETVFGYLKNRLEIEHTRHRSPVDFLVHIFSTLISYSIKSKKPSISYTSFLNPEFALVMGQHFKLTGQEFCDNTDLFNVLEVEAKQVVDKNYEELSAILKKQHKQLILVNHPDKGRDKNRFDQIYKAYQELKKYIEPLESGNPCVKVSVGAESNGRLTACEFHYRKKLFDTLGIGEEAIGKDFDELTSILKKNDSAFEEDVEYCFLGDIYSSFFRSSDPGELNKRLSKPSMRLFLYISPLEEKRSLIEEDKKTLALKFIERKNALLLVQKISVLTLGLLTTVTIGCYFSWWIIAFNIIINNASHLLIREFWIKEGSIGNRRLFGFDGIGDESRKDMNQEINRGSMASVFNF